jgi:hypothetical protein
MPARALARCPGGVARAPRAGGVAVGGGGWPPHAGHRTVGATHRTVGAVHLTMGASGRRVPRCPLFPYSCDLARDGVRRWSRCVLRGKRAVWLRYGVQRCRPRGVGSSWRDVQRTVLGLCRRTRHVRCGHRDLRWPSHGVSAGRRRLRCAFDDLRSAANHVRYRGCRVLSLPGVVRFAGRRGLSARRCAPLPRERSTSFSLGVPFSPGNARASFRTPSGAASSVHCARRTSAAASASSALRAHTT